MSSGKPVQYLFVIGYESVQTDSERTGMVVGER